MVVRRPPARLVPYPSPVDTARTGRRPPVLPARPMIPTRPTAPRLLVLSLALGGLLAACGGGEAPASAGGEAAAGAGAEESVAPEAPAEQAPPVEIPTVTYAWDPQAGDPSVSAEDGGPGFTGEGWETNMPFPAIGSAEAVKGGRMRRYMPDWPATLRQYGKDWNTSINYMVADLCYESLLMVHPSTLEYTPRLATHWRISEDKSTYTYRINPCSRSTGAQSYHRIYW